MGHIYLRESSLRMLREKSYHWCDILNPLSHPVIWWGFQWGADVSIPPVVTLGVAMVPCCALVVTCIPIYYISVNYIIYNLKLLQICLRKHGPVGSTPANFSHLELHRCMFRFFIALCIKFYHLSYEDAYKRLKTFDQIVFFWHFFFIGS